MKTVMKKLLSIMLVALLLVCAVPFQASAASYEYSVVIDGYTMTAADADGSVTAAELYDFLELSKGEDAGIDAWIAGIAPVDVTAGKVVLKVPGASSGSGSDDTVVIPPADSEEDKKEDSGILEAETFTLTVDTGSGSYPKKVSYGDKYLDVLAPPARVDREFKGWMSEKLGRMIKADDYVEGNDTVTAVWSALVQYNLTLDENREGEEVVAHLVRVTYNEEIYAKVSKYQPEREGYVFMGWKLNGKMITKDTVYELQGDATAYAVWKLESDTEDKPMGGVVATPDGKVWLEIYTNGKTDKYVKKVDITSYAADNKITRAEVETVAKKYVTAKSGYSLVYEGLFNEQTWWEFTHDPETNGAASIVVNKDGDDYIYVMVNNVKDVSNVPVDKTNPQTGDAIGFTLAMMLSSGGAILTLGKKKFF